MRQVVFILTLFLLACAPSSTNNQPSADNPKRVRATYVLQFWPANETEYPRQEALFRQPEKPDSLAPIVGNTQPLLSAHYRLARGLRPEASLRSADGLPLDGTLRFAGASADHRLDPTSIRGGTYEYSVASPLRVFLPPGDYAVDLQPALPLWPAQRQFIRLTSAGISSTGAGTLDFVLAKGPIVHGSIRNAVGQPLAGIQVRTVASNGALASAPALSTTDGSYELALGTGAGPFRLEFSPASTSVPLPRVVFDVATTTDTTLSIEYLPLTPFLLRGRVVDETGASAANVSVILTAKATTRVVAARRVDTQEYNSDGFAAYRTKTGADGSFELTIPLGSWSYVMIFQPPLDKPYGGLTVDIPNPLEANHQLWSLASKRKVSGRVVSDDNTLVSAEIVLTRTVALQENQESLRLQTNANGEFEAFLDPTAAAFDVTVTPLRPPYARCIRAGVSLSSLSETFMVRKGIVATGYVEDANGNPLSQVAVTLVDALTLNPGGHPRVLAEATPTEADGRFMLVVPVDTASGCR